jgi:geranylgeranyl diphosphate synthase, type I
LTENLNRAFYQEIINQWEKSEAWPDYIAAMFRVFPLQNRNLDPDQDPTRWAQLPGLCCQAAGGQKTWADRVTAAWFLLYTAAHVFDTLEDKDLPDPWWSDQGVGISMNVGTGLMISAAQMIDLLYRDSNPNNQAAQIAEDFYQTVLIMGSGQHHDLTHANLNLEQWFANANAKSGEFFSLGCRSGARLASPDNKTIRFYSTYGKHLGLLLQIMDDLDDWHTCKVSDQVGDLRWLSKSLPATYACEVLPEKKANDLRHCLDQRMNGSDSVAEALNLITDSGAELYLYTEIEKNYTLAQEALRAATPEPVAEKALISLLDSLHPDKSI